MPTSWLFTSTLSNPHTTITAPTLVPPLQPTVHTPVTVVIGVVLGLITLGIGYQIVRICLQGPRTISNFNIALLFTFCWGILRTALVVTYAVHKHVAANINVWRKKKKKKKTRV